MSKIDFSKIPVLELPVKSIPLKIRGTEQPVEIKPIVGEERIRYIDMCAKDTGVQSDNWTLERMKLALSAGAGMNEMEIMKLIHLDWKAAFDLCADIYDFMIEYEKSLAQEVKAAEKNSEAEAGNPEVTVP